MKKFSFKLCYDIVMTVLMLLLMVYSLTGGYLHELFGIIAVLMFIFHVMLNIKWVCSVSRKTFNGKSAGLDKVKYFSAVLLCILVIFTGLSGILISCSFFTDIYARNRALWVYIHNLSAYSLLILISVHTGLHWKMIMAFFRKKLNLGESRLRKLVLRLIALILALLGIKAHTNKDFIDHFIPDLPEYNPEKTTSQDALSNHLEKYNNRSDNHTVRNMVHAQAVNMINLTDSSTYKAIPLRGDSSYNFDSVPPEQNETEEEYLGRLRCTGCSKRCPLISPRCNTGAGFAMQASDYYNSFSSDSQDDSQAPVSEDTPQSEEQYIQEEQDIQSEAPATEKIPQKNSDENVYENNSSSEEKGSAVTEHDKEHDDPEIILSEIDDEDNTGLKELFTTMIPVMSLYISGTYYILKIGEKLKKKK